MYCRHCGKELPSPDSDVCTNCGKIVEKPKVTESYSESINRPTKAWYLVPIFFGIMGGLVMYLVLKDEDKRMAKKGLVLGIILGAIGIALVVIIYGVLFSFLAFSHLHNQPTSAFIPNPQQLNRAPYFPGVVEFNDAVDGGGANDNRVFKQIPSTLPKDQWTADFDYKFMASSIPAAYPFALTSSSANPEQQGPLGSTILVYHGDNSDVLHLRVHSSSTSADSPGLYTGIPIYPNIQYFVRLAKTPTELTLSVFSDPTRTMQIPGSPVTVAISTTDFDNLNFVQHSTSLSSGPARALTAVVDNTKIVTKGPSTDNQILFEDGYASSKGWTQVGSSVTVNGPAD